MCRVTLQRVVATGDDAGGAPVAAYLRTGRGCWLSDHPCTAWHRRQQQRQGRLTGYNGAVTAERADRQHAGDPEMLPLPPVPRAATPRRAAMRARSRAAHTAPLRPTRRVCYSRCSVLHHRLVGLLLVTTDLEVLAALRCTEAVQHGNTCGCCVSPKQPSAHRH